MLRAGALLGLRRAASSAPRASHARRARCVSASVSGPRYAAAAEGAPRVTLYTKEGCTLCDKAAEVLAAVRGEADHALEAVDITDDGNERWHGMYKVGREGPHCCRAYRGRSRTLLLRSLRNLSARILW